MTTELKKTQGQLLGTSDKFFIHGSDRISSRLSFERKKKRGKANRFISK